MKLYEIGNRIIVVLIKFQWLAYITEKYHRRFSILLTKPLSIIGTVTHVFDWLSPTVNYWCV